MIQTDSTQLAVVQALIALRDENKALTAEVDRLKAVNENALMILRQLDWLYSKENENARMWELKIGGLSPTEWMGDIVQKAREIIKATPEKGGGEDE